MNSVSTSPWDACTLCRLVEGTEGPCAAESLSAGQPFLALSLDDCWTFTAAKHSGMVGQHLSAALARNPGSSLLQSESTWIALHLISQAQLGTAASAKVQAQIALLKGASSRPLAEWQREEGIAKLGPSPLRRVLERQRSALRAELECLSSELGSEWLDEHGVTEATYRWAQLAIQSYGLRFSSGATVLVPVLASFTIEASPTVSDAMMMVADRSAKTLVLFAAKDYAAGDRLHVSCQGLADMSSSVCLLRSGQLMQEPQTSHVIADFSVKLQYSPAMQEALDILATSLLSAWNPANLSSSSSSSSSIFCMPVLSAPPPVEVVDGVVHVNFSPSTARPLPANRTALAALGMAVLSDQSQLRAIVAEETEVQDICGSAQCVQRGLRLLKTALISRVSDYDGLQDGTGIFATLLKCERSVLMASLKEVETLLSSGVDGLALPGTACDSLGSCALQTLRSSQIRMEGCSRSLRDLAERLKLAEGSGSDSRSDHSKVEALTKELALLRKCLHLSIPSAFWGDSTVGDRAASSSALVGLVRSHRSARDSAHAASQAAEELKLLGETSNAQALLERAKVLAKTAPDMALKDVKTALAQSPQHYEARRVAEELVKSDARCRAGSAAALAAFQDGRSQSTEQSAVLTGLRRRLEACGFTALSLGTAAGSFGLPRKAAIAASLEGIATEARRRKCSELASLLLFGDSLEAARVSHLLGGEVVEGCLSNGFLTMFDPLAGTVLQGQEAEAVIRGRSQARVFATAALVPCQGVLVAADFEPCKVCCHPGDEEGVLWPTEAELQAAELVSQAAPEGAKSKSKSCLLSPCGGGAGSLIAARQCPTLQFHLVDENPRARRFVSFAVVLNEGAQSKVTVANPTSLQGRSFDVILSVVNKLPNPEGIVSKCQSFFATTPPEEVADNFLSSFQKGALLNEGGCFALLAPGMAASDQLAQRLARKGQGRQGESGEHIEAIVVRGRSITASAVVTPLTEQAKLCSVELMAWSSLLSETPLAPAAVLATRGGAGQKLKVTSCWPGNSSFFDQVLEEFSSSLLRLATAKSQGGSSLSTEAGYSFDWDDLAQEEGNSSASTAPPSRVASPQATLHASAPSASTSSSSSSSSSSPSSSPWQRLKPATAHSKRNGLDIRGATFADATNLALLGWSPPLLCDSFWEETPRPETKDQLPREQIAIVEVKGCRLPGAVEKALRKSLNCSARYTFDGKKRVFELASGGLEDGYGGPIAGTDVLLVPLSASAYADAPLDALCAEVLGLLQAVFELMEEEKRYVSVMLLTTGALGPMLADAPKPSPACPLRGVVRVAKIELPMVPVHFLDTDAFAPAAGAGDTSALAKQILCELEATDGTMEVAYRGKKRFCPRLRLSARNQLRTAQPSPSLKACSGSGGGDGVAVITGGLGGLGIVTAEALAEAGLHCLVLCSRSGSVAREGQGLEERLQALAASGVEIVKEKCDTSNETQVQSLLQRARSLKRGPLRVIVHAAGVLDDKMFLRQNAESMRKSFAPKADGAWFLHKHSSEDPVEMFMCYSSVSSTFGHPGQANYSASNAYMDELCRWRSANHKPSVSVAWPGVKDVGMAAKILESDESQFGIGVETVKKVVRQVVAGTRKIEAVQAVCAAGQLVPMLRHHASMLEPLYKDFISRLQIEDGQVQCKLSHDSQELVPLPSTGIAPEASSAYGVKASRQ